MTAPPTSIRPADTATAQRRTLALLISTQIIGGVGVTIGITVGALLAARLGGAGISGLASSSAVVGAALLAVPVTRITNARGRRPGLATAYAAGALGGVLVVTAAVARSVPLLFAGMLLFGGGTTAGLQSRFAAVDLAQPARAGRHLSLVVWATTVGAVVAPNFAAAADEAVGSFGVPPLSGPFVVSALAFVAAGAVLLVLLRPDPLLTARALARSAPGPAPGGAAWTDGRREEGGPPLTSPGLARAERAPAGSSMREALRVVRRFPAAMLGMISVAAGHLVMVTVMSMTPVHIGESHGDADVLRIVGIVLSLHIAGMFALSPLVGWLTDRLGRRPVILGGVGLLLAACAVAGTAGHDTPRLSVGLTLLGLGWSGTMVAGSTLLSESVPVADRPGAQGLSDLVMGLAGASGGAVSGFIVATMGYPKLNLLAAIAVLPLIALALRPADR